MSVKRPFITGFVSWDQRRHKWLVRLTVAGKTRFVGRFDSKEAAQAELERAKRGTYWTNELQVCGETE